MRSLSVRLSVALFIAASLGSCGGGSGDKGTPDAGTPGLAASKLFIGNSGATAGTIGSTANPVPPVGVLSFDRTIGGASTLLTPFIFDFALDELNDRLYVADLRNILVFENVSIANGNVAPSRVVTTIPGTVGGFFGGLYLDTANDRLYAGASILATTKDVQVFDHVSQASAAPPARTITFTSNTIMDIAVDATLDILYVFNGPAGGGSQILAFDHASTLSGPATPSRIVASFTDTGALFGISMFLDAAHDRLYVPHSDGTISVFDGVHAAINATPTRTINLPVTAFSMVFVERASDRLYALDVSGLTIIPNASTANGPQTTFTRLTTPSGQAIWVKP